MHGSMQSNNGASRARQGLLHLGQPVQHNTHTRNAYTCANFNTFWPPSPIPWGLPSPNGHLIFGVGVSALTTDDANEHLGVLDGVVQAQQNKIKDRHVTSKIKEYSILCELRKKTKDRVQ